MQSLRKYRVPKYLQYFSISGIPLSHFVFHKCGHLACVAFDVIASEDYKPWDYLPKTVQKLVLNYIPPGVSKDGIRMVHPESKCFGLVVPDDIRHANLVVRSYCGSHLFDGICVNGVLKPKTYKKCELKKDYPRWIVIRKGSRTRINVKFIDNSKNSMI
ncbi:unnamed protein product [Ambrosiozyma monospora]|uniref:Unnamed protein product n=1 Tax=Ambrosiozyma monospora TaxID=43982 RepID=A0ACB5T210_AMBMO|nr:unnamed protein product [Ambrosiozyma monospora]